MYNRTVPCITFIVIFFTLSIVQLYVKDPIILLERFVEHSGWIEILIISLYGAFVTYKMQQPENVAKWRKYTWFLFSIVFFSQLFLGIIGFDKFLMTGKLHLPIPTMILSGPLYRSQVSFMTILFISTIILSGPAWCSHLCYFGAIDNSITGGKAINKPIRNRSLIKNLFLLFVIAFTIALKWFNISNLAAIIAGGTFGIIGLIVIVFFSRKKGKMYHCLMYCPIGTIVNYTHFINPFRMYIDNNCTTCLKCTSFCRYDALNVKDIKKRKPALTCTLCGDCITSCHTNSIKYRFFKLNPEKSRNLYLIITISLHAIFLALARI